MTHDLTQGSTPQRRRDPEDRPIDRDNQDHKREKAHDKTLADSFPTSDPPSTIPDPGEEDSIDTLPVHDIKPPASDLVNPADRGLGDPGRTGERVGGGIDKVA